MITDKKKTPKEIFIQEDYGKNEYGINQDENIIGMVKYIRYDLVPKVEEKYKMPNIPIHEDTSVTSRMQYIDDELKPIAEFILEYAGWNLHKEEWNHPVLEVPVFRVLDALITKGKPYTSKDNRMTDEEDILECWSDGMTITEIANELGLSKLTVIKILIKNNL